MVFDIVGCFDVIGVLVVELMECEDGFVVVNELVICFYNIVYWMIDGVEMS